MTVSSIAAPDSWAAVDPDDFGLTAEEFAQLFPDLEPEMIDQMVAGLAQGAILVAYDMVERPVERQHPAHPGGGTLEVLEVEVPRQLAALGAEGVESAVVDTAAGEALRIEYSLDVALPGQADVDHDLWGPVLRPDRRPDLRRHGQRGRGRSATSAIR